MVPFVVYAKRHSRSRPAPHVQHAIRQRPLKFQRLDGLALQPEVELLSCGQDHRHRFGMDGRDDGVGFRGQKPE